MSIGIWIAIILGIIILAVIFLYNSLIRLKNEIKNSLAQIDVQLKRRHDLIPNLINTVKGYAKHEKNLLTEITKERTAVMKAATMGAKAQASSKLSNALGSLMVQVENYPQLKANENFLQLQEELTGTENKISYSRQHYNDVVMTFNNKIQVFPNNLIANSLGFKQAETFEVDEAEKKNVKVEF
ncbi:MAG: LemA family protein [Candidatus Woesearchaeota archaeon]|jgi:LemA protein|nr:LemA family protein [Candidatus Woesearchaeota archaeon]MDP7181455.1 LemA family protein [Candidatus Woesearchaeota archaeon]MDP7198497.1 LemA family protein [Candidatus Woesearchaeota archaeon]MDP7466761.1 LemA family protein [Candidatus Woesearchaeota archaeon]MDP7647986.1 LemA family protein [Candidatus Woesearchaeota archaeon]